MLFNSIIAIANYNYNFQLQLRLSLLAIMDNNISVVLKVAVFYTSLYNEDDISNKISYTRCVSKLLVKYFIKIYVYDAYLCYQ